MKRQFSNYDLCYLVCFYKQRMYCIDDSLIKEQTSLWTNDHMIKALEQSSNKLGKIDRTVLMINITQGE